MKKITIPIQFGYPAVKVCINDIEYICLTGKEIEVEDCVAELFESMQHKLPKPAPIVPPFIPGGGSTGGGEKILYMDAALLNAGGAYPVDADDYTTAVIPAEATFVSLDAFDNLPNLDTLIVFGDCEFEVYTETSGKDTYYHYVTTECDAPIRRLIVSGRATIPTAFMKGVTTLEEISVVGSVNDYAFQYCGNLKKISLDGVDSIGYNAFEDCIALTEVVIPPSVTSIMAQAFAGGGMKTVILPDNMTTIPLNMFAECPNLSEVTIPNSVTTIEIQAFEFCSSLTEITIPASVTYLGYSAFYECTNLKTVTILGMETPLEDVIIPSTTTIRGYAGSTAETFANANGNPFEAIE